MEKRKNKIVRKDVVDGNVIELNEYCSEKDERQKVSGRKSAML